MSSSFCCWSWLKISLFANQIFTGLHNDWNVSAIAMCHSWNPTQFYDKDTNVWQNSITIKYQNAAEMPRPPNLLLQMKESSMFVLLFGHMTSLNKFTLALGYFDNHFSQFSSDRLFKTINSLLWTLSLGLRRLIRWRHLQQPTPQDWNMSPTVSVSQNSYTREHAEHFTIHVTAYLQMDTLSHTWSGLQQTWDCFLVLPVFM